MFGIDWTVVQKFCHDNMTVIILVVAITSIGGILSGLFGWPFAIFVPWWIALASYAMKKEYEKKKPK